jgi:hypothetical protein
MSTPEQYKVMLKISWKNICNLFFNWRIVKTMDELLTSESQILDTTKSTGICFIF